MTFEDAKRKYVHRFTMEHVPDWASEPFRPKGLANRYYAPQYRTDLEWYENTTFPGEGHLHRLERFCETRNQTWPLGQSLAEAYSR